MALEPHKHGNSSYEYATWVGGLAHLRKLKGLVGAEGIVGQGVAGPDLASVIKCPKRAVLGHCSSTECSAWRRP